MRYLCYNKNKIDKIEEIMNSDQTKQDGKTIMGIESDLSIIKYKVRAISLLLRSSDMSCVPSRDEMGGIGDIIHGFSDEIEEACKHLVKLKNK